VVRTTEVKTWMTAPPDEALSCSAAAAGGTLRIVARGIKEDPAGPTTSREAVKTLLVWKPGLIPSDVRF
jgi:hypothetical protein